MSRMDKMSSCPAWQVQDVEGHPGAVTLLQGSLLVEGKVGWISAQQLSIGSRKSLEGLKQAGLFRVYMGLYHPVHWL